MEHWLVVITLIENWLILVVHLLKDHGLRLTDSRKDVVQFFLRKGYAIGQPELETQLSHFDRVTIYRTLNTLLEKGILHKVFDDSGVMKYALCPEHCHVIHEHQEKHLHFKCVQCDHIVCLDTVSIPHIELPHGYTFLDAQFLVRGVCRNCQSASQ